MKNKLILFFLFLFSILIVNAEGEATITNIKVNKKECKCIEYNCTVETDSDKGFITYDLVDSSASVDRQSGFSVDLTSLSTTIKINVSNTLNNEKIDNTYTIVITKHEKNADNTIKSLKVNGTNIELKKDVIVYPYLAKYDEKKMKIEAEVNDPKAKIITKEMEFEFDLERTSESFDFVVQAENEEELTYRIFFTREEKPDTSLKSIKLDHGSIDYDKKILEYSLNVEYSVNKLKIDAEPNSKDAVVKIEQKDLVVGENIIKIIVTNKKATSTYILNVTREENIDKSVANLKSLKIKEYDNLEFKPNVLDYNLYFKEVPTFLNINAEPLDDKAKVEIVNNEDLVENDRIIIKVKLDNITREYTLNILNKKSEKNSKKAIVVTLIILIITIILLFIQEIRSKNKKKRETIKKIKEMNKKKEKEKKELKTKKETKKTVKNKNIEEDEIEII